MLSKCWLSVNTRTCAHTHTHTPVQRDLPNALFAKREADACGDGLHVCTPHWKHTPACKLSRPRLWLSPGKFQASHMVCQTLLDYHLQLLTGFLSSSFLLSLVIYVVLCGSALYLKDDRASWFLGELKNESHCCEVLGKKRCWVLSDCLFIPQRTQPKA
jgi:hypothetical protein